MKLKKENLKERLSNLYDKLFERADKLIKEFNPCTVKIEKIGSKQCVTCFEIQHLRKNSLIKNNWYFGRGKYKDSCLCCRGCEFHNPDIGCTAEKPLMCKLWICETLKSENPELYIKLSKLKRKINKFFNLPFRSDKKMVFKYIV